MADTPQGANQIPQGIPQAGMPYGHLEDLLRQNLEIARQNNRMLKRMQRNAIIGWLIRLVGWLIVLGVPLYFLSPYFAPVMSAITGQPTASTTFPSSVFGLPSPAALEQVLQAYTARSASSTP